MDNQKNRLTSSEITSLWAQYIQDTMSVCISKYVLAKVKDSEVSARKDIRDHYYQCNIDAMDLYNKSIEILIWKLEIFILP
ncbi:DUF3231 family protein [Priestia megaterium]|uniref:DUF3231 family protein n=1 Tax=Priestia megaterium TaxID=1404 RepID=UPI002E23E0F1|nr:DUF3231 family protein [Priestia megaterium]